MTPTPPQQAARRSTAVVPARALTSHGARAVETSLTCAEPFAQSPSRPQPVGNPTTRRGRGFSIENHLTDAELFELAVCRWMDRRRHGRA